VASVGKKVIPFVFSAKSKSDLGWVGLAESGRYLEYLVDGAEDTVLFWRQLAAVEFEVLEGPGRLMRWAVYCLSGSTPGLFAQLPDTLTQK